MHLFHIAYSSVICYSAIRLASRKCGIKLTVSVSVIGNETRIYLQWSTVSKSHVLYWNTWSPMTLGDLSRSLVIAKLMIAKS